MQTEGDQSAPGTRIGGDVGTRGGEEAGGRRTAFVLAGGGFKGAFELGALEHLIDTLGVTPDIVTSASAGSILGMVLSQGRTLDEFSARLADARQVLLSMTHTDMVFGEQPWMAELEGTPFADSLKRLISDRTQPTLPGDDPDPDALPDELPRAHHHHDWSRVAGLSDKVRAVAQARREFTKETSSVLNLDPFEAAIRGRVDVGIPAVDPELIARPGLELRMAVTAVRARQTHYVRNDGTVLGGDARTPLRPGTPANDVVDGAIASSSVPMVFPARQLGDETYVDGGVLQNIPLAAAVALGAEEIYTVIAVPVKEGRKSISLWSARQLGFVQTQADNLAAPLPEGARNTVITPTIEVVGSFEVHRGLMQIDIDYGRMRAEETLAELDDGQRRIVTECSDTVTVERDRAWHLEQACLLDGSMSPERLEALRGLKASVRSAVAARTAIGFPEPAGAAEWWTGYELHSTDPADFPPSFPATFA